MRSKRLKAVNAMESAHSDQASKAAVRWIIGLTPRPSSHIPSVTIALYSTTVSRAFRDRVIRTAQNSPDR
jgi:hypothetical protein